MRIDALDGMVAVEVGLIVLKYLIFHWRKMVSIGIGCIIFTDISKDGTLEGVNLEQLDTINKVVDCNIIASGVFAILMI